MTYDDQVDLISLGFNQTLESLGDVNEGEVDIGALLEVLCAQVVVGLDMVEDPLEMAAAFYEDMLTGLRILRDAKEDPETI